MQMCPGIRSLLQLHIPRMGCSCRALPQLLGNLRVFIALADILERFGFRAESCWAELGICAMCGPWEHREYAPVEKNPLKIL